MLLEAPRQLHLHGYRATALIIWQVRALEGTDTSSKHYIHADAHHSLITIMLGRLRMNTDDCIKEYETLGAKVFGHSRCFHLRSPFFWPRGKYNHKVLQEIVRDVVKRYMPKVADFPGGRNLAFDENRCRV